jgi:hypothetical protein
MSMGQGVSAVYGVVLMWFGGFGVRVLLDGVTVAMSVMAAALPVFVRPGRPPPREVGDLVRSDPL